MSDGDEVAGDRRALVILCLFALVGFGHENVIAPVLPLIVIDRGGDAAVVGLLVAVFGVPAIVLRPLLGRWLDTAWRPRIVRAGAAIVSLAPLGYVVPSLIGMLVTRTGHGMGWAAYGTGAHLLLARIAPVGRRSESAGYFNAMPALAVLLGPAIGLWLFANAGEAAPFVVSAGLGLSGLLLTRWLPIEAPPTPAAAEPAVPIRRVAGLFDPAAIVPMTLLATFMSVQSLFVIFAPLFARAAAIPIGQLAIYYPAYGTVLLLSQLLLGRVSDRFGRWPTIVIACITAIGGLTLTVVLGGLAGLILGGGLYGIATALTTTTLGAVAMETAPPGRTGSAMATYSLGYQLGISMGGLLWGAIISLAGYPWPFVGGAAMVAASLALGAATIGRRRS